MVRIVVAGLQEVLHQEKFLTKNTKKVETSVNHVANAVKNTQKKFAPQLQKMQAMMQ